jgi:hypothetical protein
MKFDFAIGNPPYQEETENNGRQSPVYNKFMDEAYKVANCVELITPARFLFNAGQTPKAWNDMMLKDEHFKVLQYEADASKVFSNTEIKGGVAITIRDESKKYGKIGIFTEYEELNTILYKVIQHCDKNISDICFGAVPYRYAQAFRDEYPEWVELAGDSFDLRTNALDKLGTKIFFSKKPNGNNYVKIFGLYNKSRAFMWVKKKYISVPSNFEKYKLMISKANGSGKFGEALSKMVIGKPKVGHTQSFISVGNFETEIEVLNLEKYIKSKFCRCMLSILRTTQDTTPYKWKYIPLQDITYDTCNNRKESIARINRQLYEKYGLSDDEISFIETNVKEME